MSTLGLLWLPAVTLVSLKLTTQATLVLEDLIAETFSKERKGTNTRSTILTVLLVVKAAKKMICQCYLILLVRSIYMRKEQRFSFSQKLKCGEKEEEKKDLYTNSSPFSWKKEIKNVEKKRKGKFQVLCSYTLF